MKIDRQMAILGLLSKHDKITIPFLSEKLEVSKRTIHRDIEDLCMAGIPILTLQGRDGGISLMEGYTIDKNLLKKGDWESIVVGLKGLESISSAGKMNGLMSRLPIDASLLEDQSTTMMIDLASHYKSSLTNKIQMLSHAIEGQKLITFTYYSPKGEKARCVEPYKIVYQWSDWYLVGYDLDAEGFRVFKLNRLWVLNIGEESFKPRRIDADVLDFNGHLKKDTKTFTALFEPSVKYLLVETYGPSCYQETEEGLLFEGRYTNTQYIASWLYSFGNKVKLIKPQTLIDYMNENGHCYVK